MEWYSREHLYNDYPKNERREEIESLTYEELIEDFYNSCIQVHLEINQEDAQLLIDVFNDEYECHNDIENIKEIIGLLKDIIAVNYESVEEHHIYIFNYFRKLRLNNFEKYKYLQNIEEIIAWMMYESYMYQVCFDKKTYKENFYDFESLLNRSIEEITKNIEHTYNCAYVKLILASELIEIISHFFGNEELYDNCSRVLRKAEYDFETQFY